jgi:hypothetical protein
MIMLNRVNLVLWSFVGLVHRKTWGCVLFSLSDLKEIIAVLDNVFSQVIRKQVLFVFLCDIFLFVHEIVMCLLHLHTQ